MRSIYFAPFVLFVACSDSSSVSIPGLDGTWIANSTTMTCSSGEFKSGQSSSIYEKYVFSGSVVSSYQALNSTCDKIRTGTMSQTTSTDVSTRIQSVTCSGAGCEASGTKISGCKDSDLDISGVDVSLLTSNLRLVVSGTSLSITSLDRTTCETSDARPVGTLTKQ